MNCGAFELACPPPPTSHTSPPPPPCLELPLSLPLSLPFEHYFNNRECKGVGMNTRRISKINVFSPERLPGRREVERGKRGCMCDHGKREQVAAYISSCFPFPVLSASLIFPSPQPSAVNTAPKKSLRIRLETPLLNKAWGRERDLRAKIKNQSAAEPKPALMHKVNFVFPSFHNIPYNNKSLQ